MQALQRDSMILQFREELPTKVEFRKSVVANISELFSKFARFVENSNCNKPKLRNIQAVI